MAESEAFRQWLRTENLVQTVDIEEFSGAVIGFDAEDYINLLLQRESTREPLLPALGGLPFALTDYIDKDLEEIQTNFKKGPVFVFNGVDLALHDRKTISKESQKAARILDEAWKVYDQGHAQHSVDLFGKTCSYRTSHILRYLYYYLHSKPDVTVVVAPYSGAAQLAHFDENRYVSGAFGSASLLVYNVDKVILNFDWENRQASFVDQEEVLQKLMISHDQLVDFLLLSGSSILPPIPEIDNEALPKVPEARKVLNRAGMDGHLACLQAKDDEYTALYRKAKAAIRNMVVIQVNGEISPLNPKSVPNDVHEFVGTRLPAELLAYLKDGLIGPRVLSWRARQEIFESPPLDGGNSQVYKDVIQDKLRPMRIRTLGLLTSRLHRYFQKNDVDVVCWFNENEKRALGITDLNLDHIGKDAESWHVREQLRKESARTKDIDLDKTPIQYAVTLLSDESLAKRTVTRRTEGSHSDLVKTSDIIANIMWRFLQDRGYINSDHTLSAWGKALKAAFERAAADNYLGKTDPAREGEEAIFMAFELLKLDVLNGKNLFPSPPYTGLPTRGNDQDKAAILLISRIASLGCFKHGRIGYTGPLSRHLLAYHQLTVAVRNSLRDLAEVHAANLFLNASAVRLRDSADYADIGARLPFVKEPDLGLALVVKSHLDELCQPVERRTDIHKWFNHAVDIDGDIKRAWKMWDAINAGIQAADSAIVSSETRDLFGGVDSWLANKRREPSVATSPRANGTGNGSN